MPKQWPTTYRESARVIYEPVSPGQHLARRARRNISRSRSAAHACRTLRRVGAAATLGLADLRPPSQRLATARQTLVNRASHSPAAAIRCRSAYAETPVPCSTCTARALRFNLGSERNISTRATGHDGEDGGGRLRGKPADIGETRSLFEFETPVPQPGDSDLLVRVAGGVRQSRGRQVAHAQQGTGLEPVILGWDAAGIVEAGGPRLQPVQAGRPRLLRRQHQPARHRRALPPGRRAHRRPQAEVCSSFAAGRGAAADHADRLGAAVRPHRREARRRAGPALAPDRRRRRRRRLDRHPARAQAHRPLGHRHCLASADAGLGAGPRRAARHRPQQAVRAAAEGGRLRQRRHRAGTDGHARATPRRSPRWCRRKAALA